METIAGLSSALWQLVEPWPVILAFDLGRYVFAAGLVSCAIALVSMGYRERRAVRTLAPAHGQWRREFAHSVVAATVFSAAGFGVYHGARQGVFDIYHVVGDFGWAYWGFSLALIIVAHDAYFYWTHRFMHRPRVFRWLHRTHHRSVAPTQWAAYAFSPGEALVQAAFLPLFLLWVPMHYSVLFIWITHQVLRNVIGHCGYEFMPRHWLATWWGRWLTTTLHHDLHHAHATGNFGLYFTWWDRWCGTEREDYRLQLARLINRIDPPKSALASTAER